MDDFEKAIDKLARDKKVNISKIEKILDIRLEEIKEGVIREASK